jgi:prevent-host-death family protein
LHRLTLEERALYDDLRDNRIRPGLRLEQEQIGFHWLAHRLQYLDGTTASDSGILPQDHKKTILSLSQIWSTAMRYSSQVKPISYLKANAAEVLTHLAEQRVPMVITQNGEAKAVLQDVASFEETQETLALLKILALGNQDVAAGKVKPVADVAARLRAKRPTA